MRVPSVPFAVAWMLTFALPAFASYGTPPPPTPASPRDAGDAQRPPDGVETPRQQAEPYFRDAYDDVVRGTRELASGDARKADKRFRRALDRSREAVGIDSTYAEAWNLVGFTSRKLGDYPHSFEAYRAALRQKPDFALAHEYFGEGLLETGDLAGAMEHLAALRRIGDQAMIAELQGAIDRWRAAHPDSTSAGTPK